MPGPRPDREGRQRRTDAERPGGEHPEHPQRLVHRVGSPRRRGVGTGRTPGQTTEGPARETADGGGTG
ncbi:hypothetical protein CXF34_10375 [Corynebacterium bovis]|nr:hypothetical protein CXF34_10375 [Corynebacterium bovis]